MKSGIYFFSTILMVVLFLNSCTQSPETLIVGSWQCVSITSDGQFGNDDIYKQTMQEIAASTSIEYNKDYTYQMVSNGNTTLGTYRIIGDGVQLEQTDKDSQTKSVMNIEVLNNEEFVFSTIDNSGSQPVKTTTTLKRK